MTVRNMLVSLEVIPQAAGYIATPTRRIVGSVYSLSSSRYGKAYLLFDIHTGSPITDRSENETAG